MIFRSRQSAPTDGRDASGNIVVANKVALTSKQNSDASGLKYQWGRKDPFTFATSSAQWGTYNQRGKYPVKIYTIDGVLIYQESNGSSNKDKQPVGGIIFSPTSATSMMETIKNPTILYGSSIYKIPVVRYSEYSKDLYDFYWTSNSRGIDGDIYKKKPYWHNNYLDGYISQRSKSIYDPCPFDFRVPANGTYNTFKRRPNWIKGSYIEGTSCEINLVTSWMLVATGFRYSDASFGYLGINEWYWNSNVGSIGNSYISGFHVELSIYSRIEPTSFDNSVRCIDFVSPPQQTDEIRLLTVKVKMRSILVSKTVTLKGCFINGDIKILSHLLQIAKFGELTH